MSADSLAPRFSVVVPAHNEERYLPLLLDSLAVARARYRGGSPTGAAIETIVADNASSDATAALAAARGCRVVPVARRTIGAARNGGALLARGEILCFADADLRVHPETFNVIDSTLAGGRVVAGATGVRLERMSLGLAVTWLVLVPLAVALRMDTGVVFCRREDFAAVGGYDEDRLAAEDVRFLLDLRRLGRRRGQRLARPRGAKAIASTRKFDRYGDWHYLRLMPRVGFWLLTAPHKADAFARRYWYDEQRRDGGPGPPPQAE